MFAFIFHNFPIVSRESDTDNFSSLGDTRGPFKGPLLIFNFERCQRPLFNINSVVLDRRSPQATVSAMQVASKTEESTYESFTVQGFLRHEGYCDSRADRERAKR